MQYKKIDHNFILIQVENDNTISKTGSLRTIHQETYMLFR